jgi:hypothetical protein
MLDVRIHDKYQIEFKTHYRFKRQEKDTAYDVEIYMFIPNSLDLDHDNYPKYLFYRDLQTYLRFETPTIALRHVASGKRNPFQSLETCFQKLAADPSPENISNYENQLKMFCCIVKKAMSEHSVFLSRKDDPKDIDYLVENYISHTSDILEKCRGLRKIITIPTIDEKTFSIYALIDEYMSLVTDEYSYRLLETLKKKGPGNYDEHKKAVLQLITSEIGYRTAKGYLARPKENDDNEELVYRVQSLKKCTESVLFLSTRARPEGKMVQQLIFGAAAGLAMIWATAIALYAQYIFGIFTMAFFITLVVSYIFKDRIKEVVRDYLSSKLLRFFYDQKTRICTGSRKHEIGSSRESFSFVGDDMVDDDVMELRNRDQISRSGDYSVGEKTILYRKKINVFPRCFEQVYRILEIKGVTDITRYSVARLTRKMGNPKRHLFITDGKDYRRINARKVQHINFIIRYSSHDESRLKRFRIVMDRGGIRRLEEVATAT